VRDTVTVRHKLRVERGEDVGLLEDTPDTVRRPDLVAGLEGEAESVLALTVPVPWEALAVFVGGRERVEVREGVPMGEIPRIAERVATEDAEEEDVGGREGNALIPARFRSAGLSPWRKFPPPSMLPRHRVKNNMASRSIYGFGQRD
jgi:hypothetical protein